MDQSAEIAALRAALAGAVQFIHEATMNELLHAEEVAAEPWMIEGCKLLGYDATTPEQYRAQVDEYQAGQHAAAARIHARHAAAQAQA